MMDLQTRTAKLLAEVNGYVCRFVRVEPWEADAIAAFVLHAHALEAARVTPYLHPTSAEPGCGKTLLLEVLALIVPRPWMVSGVSKAALVRKIDRDMPTLLLDEADASFNGNRDFAETMRQVLNAGNRRTGTVEMCVGEGANMTTRAFNVFSAKVIAGLNELPDTVSDRSIQIRMKPLARSETVEEFIIEDVEPEARQLRDRLEAWKDEAVEVLRGAKPDAPTELHNRAKEISRPLLAIADLAGGEWPERLRDALVEIRTGSTEYEDRSIGLQLLADIQQILEATESDRITSSDLCKQLGQMEGRPWAEFNHGVQISPNQLARRLKKYGIRPDSIRVSSGTPKGYFRSQFEDAFARYLVHGTKENHGPASAGQSGDALDELDSPESTTQQGLSGLFGKFQD